MKRIALPKKANALFYPSLPESAHACLTANSWLNGSNQVLLLISDSITKSESWGEDVAGIAEELFPGLTIHFHLFDETPNPTHPDAFERNCERASTLSLLTEFAEGKSSKHRLIIASTPEALRSACPILDSSTDSEIKINAGQEVDFARITQMLAGKLDYSSEILCEEPGQFSVRGGLIDVYPINATTPYRIDFFGDEVEEIKTFDPTSQRTDKKISSIRISSCKQEGSGLMEGAFFDYVMNSTTWVFQEPELMFSQFPLCFHQSEKVAMNKVTLSGIWSEDQIVRNEYIGFSEIDAGSGIFEHAIRKELIIHSWTKSERSISTNLELTKTLENEKGQRVNRLFELLKIQDQQNGEIIIAAGAETEIKRIKEIITEESSLERLNPRFLPLGLSEGFMCTAPFAGENFQSFLIDKTRGIILATSREILGRERSRRPMRSRKAHVQRKEVDQALDFSELVHGDYLVHHQHGICRFCQMGKIEDDSITEEAITLEFDDGIILHLPLQESHLLSRYVGLRKAKPKLAKLGGKAWAKTKSEAERAALDLAADLLRLQATRQANHGFAYSPDDQWQKEFEDAFPFTETPDQQKAIDQVKVDMESAEPMDRLVCGDVGFGKTEVAIRAAFKAVMDGKQVAMLAPTTILSQQHLNHFRERMSDFPIAIEMMSRFRTPSQQRKIAQATSAGSIDILIGTHRLLSKDLDYKDLGLLIIDEEQRFGVQHKEAIKKMRSSIDVLTLSATPIPRTLYFAMVGARSLSAIETAPVNRRPIRTDVVQKSDELLKRAIGLEVRRGGQIFYLHNRVKTIHSVASNLEKLFPKLRIAVGHGQMNEEELELVMTEFVAGEYDILVCTTIIESGLDIPNCNTMIIEGADKFGLSQLYQLRGRVGRFKRQAYAYLFVNQTMGITDKARKRLSSIKQINSFGAGFRIALRDLELRGAGNLLGSEQSGHVAGVGFEMYCKLLKESVSRLKGDEVSLRPTASVRLDFLINGESSEIKKAAGAYLPDTYILEPRLRIEFYRKLSSVTTSEDADRLEEELKDRFGELPDEVKALILESRLRCLTEQANFDLIETKENELLLRHARKGKAGERTFHRIVGRLPKLKQKKPLLKLNEIIEFLKILIHGN
ncbi:transcription-repair coupling factor [Opitutales bacterium]|nr:transcription-repair coupling factor [Opitutales bacterium]